MDTFQKIISKLTTYWENQGCIIQQGYDLEVGAGTFNPATFLRALGPEPYKSAYIEPSRRPTDGRYGLNPNRLQHFFQYQVVLKPSPLNLQELYLDSLKAIGFNLEEHDVRFVHDDWESPTLGAWGLGWEVWMDGMEVTQYTYFQSVGGQALKPVMGELTYGIERIAMYLQKVNSIYDLQWNDDLTYGDIYQKNENEFSHYNFEEANVSMWFRHFDDYEKEAIQLLDKKLPLPAYDFVMKASHAFNMLDARGVISVTERTGYITRIRNLACRIAEGYLKSREEINFPLLDRFKDAKVSQEKMDASIDSALLSMENRQEDYLLEIGSEELPATFVPIGCKNLEKLLRELLAKEEISFDEIKMYGTPRRITAHIKKLALTRNPKKEERKGPALTVAFTNDGELTNAGIGFFKSLKMEPLHLKDLKNASNISIREINGTEYLFAIITKPGKATAEILAEKLPQLILNIDFPKKMRWSNFDISFARPLRWIVSLFGNHVIPFTIGNIHAGRTSFGHRQLSPESFTVENCENYIAELKSRKVIVDFDERKKKINDQLDQIEATKKLKVVQRNRVLDEVLNLVEWPECIVTSFNKDYLEAPKEVLVSEMIEHQRYFPLENEDGSLSNYFVITANRPETARIIEGNQRALSPRLADGVALYEQDLSTSLEEFNEKLKSVTFQKELGSVYAKVLRIQKHAKVLQNLLNISSTEKVQRASLFCKSDLVSKMVYEFPELQGTMGKYYALRHGEDGEIAQAIEEHWMPRGENESLPKTETGIILSIADKIDNLLGCFAIGLKPSSSSDPYALRRQTLGIIRILIQNELSLPIKDLFFQCYQHFSEEIRSINPEALKELFDFVVNRVKTVFLDYGVEKDEIEASVSSQITDIYTTYCKVKSLHQFRKSDNKFQLLYEVYKRAKGQLIEPSQMELKRDLLKENAEISLYDELVNTNQPFNEAIERNNYDKAYSLIAHLQPPLAHLFEEVKILSDDPTIRANRLALLGQVFDRFSQLLDFDKIQEKSIR